MREIKFRGRNHYGLWMYGYLMPTPKPTIHLDNKYSICVSTSGLMSVDRVNYEVETHTIGQFTGLFDKNGKEIYEGDIITFDNHLQGVSQVEYDYAGLDVVSNNYRTTLRPMLNNHIRVIGNIHDNPELLK